MRCCNCPFGAILCALAVTLLAGFALSSGLSASAEQENPRPARPTVPAAPAPSMQTPAKKSLFDRLGGTYPIAALVDDYVNNLPADSTVMGNPNVRAAVEKAAAAHGLPGLKYQITAFIIEAAGGPYSYHGRNMLETHKTLGITQAEWDAGKAVLQASLDKFKIPAPEQAEIHALIATTHDDIVVPSRP